MALKLYKTGNNKLDGVNKVCAFMPRYTIRQVCPLHHITSKMNF